MDLRGALAAPARAHEKHKSESPVFSVSDLTFWHSIGGCVPDRFEVAYSPWFIGRNVIARIYQQPDLSSPCLLTTVA